MAGSLDTVYNGDNKMDVKVKKTFTAPLSALYIEPGFNIRHGGINRASVESLKLAYAEGTPVPPIVVEVMDDGRLKTMGGHNRYTALTELLAETGDEKRYGRAEVRHFNGDATAQIKFMVGENGHGRTNLNAVDMSIACKRLADLGHSNTDIATLLGMKEPTVVYHLTIAKMSDEVKDAIIAGKIAADFAAEIFRKSGNDGVLAVLSGAPAGEKVTRKSAGLWRPSMGKSVVSLFSSVTAQITDKTAVISMPAEDWEKVQEAIKALNGGANVESEKE